MNIKNKNIEDIYPLSPMQQGLLFHSITASNLYVQQEGYELKGNLDVRAFEKAWQSAISRHSILRTAFVWENVAQPIQIVGKQVKLPLEKYDWRGLSFQQQQEKLEFFLEQDKQQELKLSQAPLMRLILIQAAEDIHYFIWSHHHLILDGWSLSLLLQEVFTSYESLHNGYLLDSKSPRPYRDYLNWLQQQDKAEAKQFWQKYLQGFSASTPLGIDYSRQNLDSQKESYSEETIQLSQDIKTSLQTIARQHQITFNTLLQGVWALLLNLYSSEEDLVFGFTSSGRPASLTGAELTLGVFINTLPIRVKVNPQQSVIPWLQQLQNQQLELLQYDYSPLMEIQSWSEIPQGLPLFESIFISQDYQTGATAREDIGNLQIRNLSPAKGETNYPLTILVEAKSHLNISIAYDCQRFAADAITRLLQHFQNLLVEISHNPHQQIKNLQILTTAERHQLLVEWNDTEVEYPTDKCIHQLFEAQVVKNPNAIAIVFANQQLTYQELNNQANQLARYLRQKTVGIIHELEGLSFEETSNACKPRSLQETEILISICLNRSVEMIVAILGILKAGFAYLPIDSSLPRDRVNYILTDAHPVLLLTQSNLTPQLAKELETICLDTDWQIISNESESNLNLELNSRNLAYSIYTSGSTGTPKGVMIQHDSLVNFVCGAVDKYQITEQDHVLQFASLSFDAAVEEIYPCLICGGTLVLADSEMFNCAKVFIAKCQHLQITVLDLPTAYWQQLVSQVVAENLTLPKCIRLVIIGGEQVNPQYVQQWQKYIGTVPQLINTYGPTEATVVTTSSSLSNNSPSRLPIGKPFGNVKVYVLNSDLQPVPIGVAGELYIGGAGVARGYFNRSELTQEKFIPNPFLEGVGTFHGTSLQKADNPYSLFPTPYSLLYKTGDLVKYLPDGNLEFIGRVDNQVKIRGFRVELGEIEAMIQQNSSAKDAVVVAREETDKGKQIVAYIIPHQKSDRANGSRMRDRFLIQLRQELESKLPNYMIPSSFTVLDEFPLTPSGKIDRNSLPIPTLTTETTYTEAVTPIEQQLVTIWQEVLGIERVGIDDNFFELGGDSIISLQIIFKASLAGIYLTPKQLFQYPTITQLAAVSSRKDVSTAEQGLITGTFPLIPIQRWFFESNFAHPHHYNQAVMLNVPSDVNVVCLEKAIAKLSFHHDLLRTQFKPTESQWQPYIRTESNLQCFTQLDFSQVPPEEVKSRIEATTEDIQASLNLSTGQIFRAVLFKLGNYCDSRLLIVIHHLVVDGVSWRILLEDFQNFYNALKNEQTLQLPAKTNSFAQWATKLADYAQSPQLHSELNYWLTTLEQPVTPLPLDYPEGENSEASTATISVALSPEKTIALRQQIPATYQTQINDVLLTALVQSFGGQTLLFDLEGHGRETLFEDIDVSRTVGWFTSIFPVILNLKDINHPGEALKTIKEQLRAIPNNGIGYGILRYLSQQSTIIQSLNSLPQAQISFNYLGQFEGVLTESSAFTPASESIGNEQSIINHRSHVLEIDSMITDGCLQLNWTYSQNLHRKSTIVSLAENYLEKLQALILHCQSPDAGGYTPSDFAEFKQSKWNQEDLAAITTAIRGSD